MTTAGDVVAYQKEMAPPAAAHETDRPATPAEAAAASPNAPPGEHAQNGMDRTPEKAARHHAEAGRKGARRIRELIQEGLLYEKEHGLKRGRQRIRQLIAEGKLYEREHGLPGTSSTSRRGRRPRMTAEQSLAVFLEALLRLVKPAYRTRLARLMQELKGERE
jgi:hypothetical protein